jgi:hypothetical protein
MHLNISDALQYVFLKINWIKTTLGMCYLFQVTDFSFTLTEIALHSYKVQFLWTYLINHFALLKLLNNF